MRSLTSMAKLRPSFVFLKQLELLSRGRLHLKDSVKNITFTYNTHGSGSSGVRQFVKEKLPPIQFKNPNVQFVLLTNRKPTPFVNIYFDDGKSVVLDVEGKEQDRIFSELASVAGMPESLVQEIMQQEAVVNPANFGDARKGRFCICEVPGQVPCPSRVPLKNVEHKWHNKNSRDS